MPAGALVPGAVKAAGHGELELQSPASSKPAGSPAAPAAIQTEGRQTKGPLPTYIPGAILPESGAAAGGQEDGKADEDGQGNEAGKVDEDGQGDDDGNRQSIWVGEPEEELPK